MQWMTFCYAKMVPWVVLVFSTACGQIQIFFFLFDIMNDLPKWGTDPNSSDILTFSLIEIRFLFLPPENIRTPLGFFVFSGDPRMEILVRNG